MNALKLHECTVCELLLQDKTKPMLQHTLFLHYKEFEDDNLEGKLIHPTYSLTKCIAALTESAESFLSSNLSSYNLVKNLKSTLSLSSLLAFINCTMHGNIVKKKNCSFNIFIIHLKKKKKNRKISKYK